jgi:hypothetical protein
MLPEVVAELQGHARSRANSGIESLSVERESRSGRAPDIERLLDERGVTFGAMRIAAGRSGLAVGFPRDPMLHISWWILGAVFLAVWLRRHR